MLSLVQRSVTVRVIACDKRQCSKSVTPRNYIYRRSPIMYPAATNLFSRNVLEWGGLAIVQLHDEGSTEDVLRRKFLKYVRAKEPRASLSQAKVKASADGKQE